MRRVRNRPATDPGPAGSALSTSKSSDSVNVRFFQDRGATYDTVPISFRISRICNSRALSAAAVTGLDLCRDANTSSGRRRDALDIGHHDN